MTTRVLDEHGALVTIHTRPEQPVGGLELCGELACWAQPIAMERAGRGWQARLRAAPGVYPIKLRIPGRAWLLDPAWRTMICDGELNGALVVGGTEEPVLHAPAPPWVSVRDDGRIVVRAALRRGWGERLVLRADEGAGATSRTMRVIRADATHLWFEGELSGSGRALEYELVLADGRAIAGTGGALEVAIAELPASPPAWWRDAVVYTIFVDRFRIGGAAWRDPSAWARETHAGGDLAGIIDALPYLADLGANALHLTPICVAPSVHRYDAIDPVAIDPAVGGDAAFERLLEAAHARGIRILVDVAAAHVHRDFAPFRDVRDRGPASPYWRWFQARHWPFVDGPDPGYAHYQKGQWEEPLLELAEPEVADAIVGWFASWVRRGVDGLHVDAAADLPLPLLARIRPAVRAIRPDAIVFGEVVPASVDRFVPGALDAATDFAHREAVVGWLAQTVPASRVEELAAAQRARGAAGAHSLGFTGTHDQPRIGTVTGDPALARIGLLAVALGARVPLLYYGDEVGLVADAAAVTREFEDSWPDRQPMPWDAAAWDADTRALVRAALALRRDDELLRRGDEDVRARGDDVLIVRRHRLGAAIDLVLHRGTESVELELPPGPARLVLACGDVVLNDGARLRLGPRAAAVIDRRPQAAAHDVELRTHNAALAAEAFVAGHVASPAYPSRLYITVTEACNLRCVHCITDAPARTSSGRARALRPWALDALDDAFGHADYVAFTHGGESLTAPLFPEVLRRIERARRRRPGRADVHLVSNGTLLDGERVASLVDLGVTSIMVSLDGATAETNDRIRVLGRFDRVVANLAAAVAWRSRHRIDLRLGVSTVVGASNVAELPALGRLCTELGVDWLKVEETYPATAFARHDLLLLAPADPRIAAALAALRDTVAGGSLVLVDHLAPPGACVCTGDPAALAFRAADDFANRATFRPCRAAWEQAAIDPDGTVHLVDYAGPPLGNLLDASLLELWNAAPALAARDQALAAAPPERRRRCIAT